MKFYIKEKVFSWSDAFSIKDEAGRDRYRVQGEAFSWGRKLHLYNLAGQELAFIQQKLWSFVPRYYVFMGGRQVAEIVQRFTLFRPQYFANGPQWEISGSFMAHEFEVRQMGRPIALISKEWMTWGDSYEIDILSSQDEIMALAVILTVDCMIEDQQS